MGQAIGIFARVCGYVFAVPLISRIYEGVITSNRDSRTIIDKMIVMLNSLLIGSPIYLVLDAYNANRAMIVGLLKEGHNCVHE